MFFGKGMPMIRFPAVMPCLLTVLSLLALSGCSADYSGKLEPITIDTLPIAPAAEELPPYRVQIGDVLDLKFRLNPELDETVTVRPDGMISTSVVTGLKVYNKTVDDVNKELKKLYSEELVNPKISTVVRAFAPTRVYVSGEVKNPGEFVVVGPNLTLTQAIARAGGMLNSGKTTQILIIRRGAGQKGQMFVANYDGATQDANIKDDVRLAPYDVVFVPKSGAAMAHKAYEQYFQQFISPSLGASYSLNNNN